MEQEGEDLMDNISLQSKGSDVEDDNHGWKSSKPKKIRKGKKKQVIGATRTSARFLGMEFLSSPRLLTELKQRTAAKVSLLKILLLFSILCQFRILYLSWMI